MIRRYMPRIVVGVLAFALGYCLHQMILLAVTQ